jgi:hypothetical protein
MYYATPNHGFHPLLAELEAAMAEMTAASAETERFEQWLSRQQAEVDPSRWTARIEAAMDKPDEMELLKLQRQEALITYESVLHAYLAAGERVNHARNRLFDACRPAVKFANELSHKSTDHWLKPLLINNCLMAEEMRRRRSEHVNACHIDASRDTTTLNALKAAFADLVAQLKRHPRCQTGSLFVGHSFTNLYPTDAVTTPKKLGFSYQRDEMRCVTPVAFVDCMNSKHPAMAKLAELLGPLAGARDRVNAAVKQLVSGEKGRVNERQYAHRLIQVLDSDYPTYAIKDENKRQHTSRVAFQSARIALYAEILGAEELRRQVVATLHEAIAECEALEAEMAADSINTTDKLFTRRLALINCLAADVMLRDLGRWLKKTHDEHYVNDISQGQGARATDIEFAELSKYYGSFPEEYRSGGPGRE